MIKPRQIYKVKQECVEEQKKKMKMFFWRLANNNEQGHNHNFVYSHNNLILLILKLQETTTVAGETYIKIFFLAEEKVYCVGSNFITTSHTDPSPCCCPYLTDNFDLIRDIND